ncbi:hypothetical protein ACFE04_026567 [Oxalis oulophora]
MDDSLEVTEKWIVTRKLRNQKQILQENVAREIVLKATGRAINKTMIRAIEEAIRQKGIEENWAAALEHNPKAFARVVMLYVDMEVNGHPLKLIGNCVMVAEKDLPTRYLDEEMSPKQASGSGTVKLINNNKREYIKPAYQEMLSNDIAEASKDGIKVRVIAGEALVTSHNLLLLGSGDGLELSKDF